MTRSLAVGWLVAAIIATSVPVRVLAQDDESLARRIGLGGRYRIGRWMPVRVDDLQIFGDQPSARWSVVTQDGGGAEVTYEQDAGPGGMLYAVAGTEAAELSVRRDGSTLLQMQLPGAGSPGTGPALVPPGTPLGLCFGDPLGIDRIGANEILQRDPTTALVLVDDPGMIPHRAIGLEAVDYLIVTGRGAELLAELDDRQNDAIADWLAGGGRVITTLGGTAGQTLRSAPWLADALSPWTEGGSTVRFDPSGLETFTNSETPLEPFDAIALPRAGGQSLLAGRTTRRAPSPLAVRYRVAFGSITVIAADLDAAPFADWPQRLDLLDRLAGDVYRPAEVDTDAARRVSGFGDLAGQTRRTLDRFAAKRSIPFSVVALAVMGWIAIVGPIDALLVRRVLGRPLAGWATLVGASVLLSVGLVLAAGPVAGPDEPFSGRTMEFIDIDLNSGYGRSTQWAVPFSHDGGTLALSTEMSAAWSPIIRRTSRRLMAPLDSTEGLDGSINIDLGGRVAVSMVDKVGAGLVGQIDSLTLPPRGSRSVVASSQFTAAIEPMTIGRRGGSELLRGSLTNPLPVDLLDGMLIYKNWAYLLPTRLPAGGRIADVDTLRQKNFRWQLTRQKALQSASESQPWRVMSTDPLRLAEMLMFHDAAGGDRYTGLTHRRIGHLDLSNLLVDDRAILIGRTGEPLMTLTVRPTAGNVAASILSHNFVRLILPVASESRP